MNPVIASGSHSRAAIESPFVSRAVVAQAREDADHAAAALEAALIAGAASFSTDDDKTASRTLFAALKTRAVTPAGMRAKAQITVASLARFAPEEMWEVQPEHQLAWSLCHDLLGIETPVNPDAVEYENDEEDEAA